MSATVPPAVTATTTTTSTPSTDVKTFRGESLEELLPQIREELGADAVILRQRDGLSGGVAGFFQKRCVEVEARAGTKRIDTYAGADDAPARAALGAGPAAPRDEDDADDFEARLEAELEAEERADAEAEAAAQADDDERFTRPAAPALPAAAVISPATVFPAAGPDVAEGMQAPAIQALFQAAAPFAETLQAADAALAPHLEDAFAAPDAPLAVEVAEAQLAVPVPAAAAPAVEASLARPAQATTQELALVQGGLSPALAGDVVSETVSHLLPFGSPRGLKRLVRGALARRIPVAGPRALGGAAIAFAGAGGSGKTLSAARLAAAYHAGSDLDVVVLALRPRDGGAELRGLLAPVGLEVEVVETAADAKARVADAGERALVVIDTPAISPGDEEAVRALAAELRRIKGAEVHLCVPATLSAAAGERLLAVLRPLRPAGIALTHVDETPTVGAVVELAIAGGPPLTFVGRDTALEGGLTLADPADIAALVLS